MNRKHSNFVLLSLNLQIWVFIEMSKALDQIFNLKIKMVVEIFVMEWGQPKNSTHNSAMTKLKILGIFGHFHPFILNLDITNNSTSVLMLRDQFWQTLNVLQKVFWGGLKLVIYLSSYVASDSIVFRALSSMCSSWNIFDIW